MSLPIAGKPEETIDEYASTNRYPMLEPNEDAPFLWDFRASAEEAETVIPIRRSVQGVGGLDAKTFLASDLLSKFTLLEAFCY